MSGWILRLSAVDARLLRTLAHARVSRFDRFLGVYTHLGDPPVIIGFAFLLIAGAVPGFDGAIGLGAGAAESGSVGTGATALHAVRSLTLAFGISQLLKRWISRPRPNLPIGYACFVRAPDRFSFPSGHATASLAIALPLTMAVDGVAASALILLPALLIGFSRCRLGVHYPGDVVAGWGIAVLSALLTH